MKLAIIGCRDFNDFALFLKSIKKVIADEKLDVTEIVSGGAI